MKSESVIGQSNSAVIDQILITRPQPSATMYCCSLTSAQLQDKQRDREVGRVNELVKDKQPKAIILKCTVTYKQVQYFHTIM